MSAPGKAADVYILSAAYGLIPMNFLTTLYERKMDVSRTIELQPQITTVFSGIRHDNYISICFVLGKTYLKALEGLQDQVLADTGSIVAYGPMGKRQTQLKNGCGEKVSPLFLKGISMKLENY